MCIGGALGRVLGIELGLWWCSWSYCGGDGGGGEVGDEGLSGWTGATTNADQNFGCEMERSEDIGREGAFWRVYEIKAQIRLAYTACPLDKWPIVGFNCSRRKTNSKADGSRR